MWLNEGKYNFSVPELTGQVRVLLAEQSVVPGPKARPLVNGVEDAGIPMKGHQQVVHERDKSEEVGVVGVSLRPVQPLPEPVDLDKSAQPQHGLEVKREIEEVERQQTEEVNVEGGGVDVVLTQLDRVSLQHPILQVS